MLVMKPFRTRIYHTRAVAYTRKRHSVEINLRVRQRNVYHELKPRKLQNVRIDNTLPSHTTHGLVLVTAVWFQRASG